MVSTVYTPRRKRLGICSTCCAPPVEELPARAAHSGSIRVLLPRSLDDGWNRATPGGTSYPLSAFCPVDGALLHSFTRCDMEDEKASKVLCEELRRLKQVWEESCIAHASWRHISEKRPSTDTPTRQNFLKPTRI